MSSKRWVVGAVHIGASFDEIAKRVFTTYDGALAYVAELNATRGYSTVILLNEPAFRSAWR